MKPMCSCLCRVLKVPKEPRVHLWVPSVISQCVCVHVYECGQCWITYLSLMPSGYCWAQRRHWCSGSSWSSCEYLTPDASLSSFVCSLLYNVVTFNPPTGSPRWGDPAPAHPVSQEDQALQRHAVRRSRHHHGLRRGHGGHLWLTQQPEAGHRAHEVPDGNTKQPGQNMQRPAALPPRVPWR